MSGTGSAGGLSEFGLRRVLVVLCVTEIVSWGVLYYAFPVLVPTIARDTGWSVATLTAAFSTGLVVAALVGVPAGRWLDRFGPRPVMTIGSVLAVPALVGIASARSLPVLFAAWMLAGVAMAGTLYAPAFAALTRWWGPRRVTALTAVTLLAGLASTVFAPLTAALLGPLGWRDTYLVLAVVLAVVTIPAHLLGLRGPWPAPEPGHHHDPARHAPAVIVRSRAFRVLVVAVALATFAAFAVVVNQVPLLIERGLSIQEAAWALGLGGLGQVLGRLGYGRLARALSVRTRTVVIVAASAATTLLLGILPGPTGLLVAAAMLAGAARGVFTLLQATAVSDRWGTTHYGRLNGLLTAPAMIATALAPWAGAALADLLGGYPIVFIVLATIAAAAAGLAVGSVPADPARSPDIDDIRPPEEAVMTEPATSQNPIRDQVRARYAASAARIAIRQQQEPTTGQPGCCGPAVPAPPARAATFGGRLYDSADAAGAPDDAVTASLGCGVPTVVADLQPGQIVLDLGSGAGADVLISAHRVAPGGRVYGLDMTPEMLDLARANAATAGVDNVEFLQGYLEDIPLPDASVDVVISNCVINLAADKTVVLREAARVLRPGGRFAVADVIADPDMDRATRDDPDAWAGCVAGALTRAEFASVLDAAGFVDIDITETHRVHAHAGSALVRATRRRP